MVLKRMKFITLRHFWNEKSGVNKKLMIGFHTFSFKTSKIKKLY